MLDPMETMPARKRLRIAVDFDGTCVDHRYPDIGDEAPGAVETLREIVRHGHALILWTMRSGETLADARRWFDERKIPLLGVNENPEQKSWTDSPKAYAHIYIDDAALGAPLLTLAAFQRPCVDWGAVDLALAAAGAFPERGLSDHEEE